MAMASDELLDQFMEDWEKLSLTEEEFESPIWQYIITNKVVGAESIIVADGEQQNDVKDLLEENDLWEPFSDDDLISSENAVTGAKFVHGVSSLELRNYQKELAEKALQGHNTIICAPTGSGKTRVATHIIFEHLKTTAGKKVAFLARTVSLAIQQYKALCKYKPQEYKITYVTGQSKDSMSLKMLLKHFDVIVMTPMILVNNIENKGLHLDKFTLMVFDECHHTRKKEPHNLLMLSYLKLKYKRIDRSLLQLPQIVGLTASIGIEESRGEDEAVKSIVSILGNLDTPYLQTVCIYRDELMAIVPKTDETIKELTELPQQEFYAQIVNVMTILENHVIQYAKESFDNEVSELVRKMPFNKHLQEYGQWVVKLKEAVQKVPMDNNSFLPGRYSIISEYLLAYNFALDMNDLVEPTDILAFLCKRFRKFLMQENKTKEETLYWGYFEELQNFVSSMEKKRNPNLITLVDTIIENLVEKGDDVRGIIFVKTRALAVALKSFLKRCDILAIKNLNANIFTGTNVTVEDGVIQMSPKLLEDTVASFRTGAIRVLVSTSVGVEGLDIPYCNLVIKYNYAGNEVTTVQTKGRARKLGGVSFLLAMDHVRRRESGNQAKAQIMEQAIKKISAMETRKIEQFIDEYQLRVIVEAEIEEANKEKRKKDPQEKQFRMVCSLCHKVGINNTQIRTIYGKHRVSIDRDFLNSGQLKQVPRRGKIIDEIEFLGPVYCQGQPVPGKICGNVLGTMIKYKKVTYFAMGIKKFGFYLGNDTNLKNFKQWDKVPYVIDELNSDDTLRYLSSASAETSYYESDSDTETSSDEDYTMTQRQRQREDREVRMRQSSEDTSVKTLANAMLMTSHFTILGLCELEGNQMLDPERTGLSTYNRLFNQPFYSTSSNTSETINIQQTMSIPSVQCSYDGSETD